MKETLSKNVQPKYMSTENIHVNNINFDLSSGLCGYHLYQEF